MSNQSKRSNFAPIRNRRQAAASENPTEDGNEPIASPGTTSDSSFTPMLPSTFSTPSEMNNAFYGEATPSTTLSLPSAPVHPPTNFKTMKFYCNWQQADRKMKCALSVSAGASFKVEVEYGGQTMCFHHGSEKEEKDESGNDNDDDDNDETPRMKRPRFD